jgi:hypothetical protein
MLRRFLSREWTHPDSNGDDEDEGETPSRQ